MPENTGFMPWLYQTRTQVIHSFSAVNEVAIADESHYLVAQVPLAPICRVQSSGKAVN